MKTFHRTSVEKIARRMSAAAFSSSLVLAAVALLVGQCSAAGRRPAVQPGQITATKAKTTSRHATKTLASLPAAAQSAISASIGRDQSSYHVRATGNGFRTMSRGGALAAEFTRSGVHVQAGKANFGMAFEGFGRGAVQSAPADATPQAKANRVEYRHGALTEWYENGPLGLEQGFDVAKAPASSASEAGKPLAIALALTGDLSASLDSGGTSLTLKRPDGQAALRYTGLAAHDAAGHQLHAWLKLDGPRVLLQVNDAGARYPIVVDPFVQVAKLTASDGEPDDYFGSSVAISGDTIVVGADGAYINYGYQGAAYVFVKPSSGWTAWDPASSTYAAKLTASDGSYNDALGSSVAISGNTIVVGAPYADSYRGSAYVFVEPQGGWGSGTQLTETTELVPSDLTSSGSPFFGTSVAISGGTIVVGALQANGGVGAAYVFVEPTTGGWASETTATETAELTASDLTQVSSFGNSVAVDGDTIVAGADEAQVGSNLSQGAAYVFVKPTTGGWATTSTYAAELTASDGAANDFFGGSVAISGDTIVAGAPAATIGSNSYQGAAYVFVEPTTGSWASSSPLAQTAKLTASDGAADDNLGGSVAISGGTVVAGAYGYNSNQGAAYVFVKPSGGWATTSSYDQKLTASDGVAGDSLGISVAISGDPSTIVAGAFDATVGSNSYQGAAYIFEPQTTGAAPTITSAASTTFTVGTAGSFTVTTTGTPTPSISDGDATLPSGVTFADNGDGTGTLSGTPAAGTGGKYNLTFTASNGVTPDATQNFTLTVDQAPAISSAASTTFTVGSAGSFTVTASGYPAPTFSASAGLPSWATLNSTTGVLSGTPLAGDGGSYSFTITASSTGTPDATQNFKLTVDEAPSITSLASTTFYVGAADTLNTFTVTTSGYPAPTNLSESGTLPRDVTFTDNGGTATLAAVGTLRKNAEGTYELTITASNGVSSTTQDFTLTVDPAQPALAFTSKSRTTFTENVPGSFTVSATGTPTPTTITMNAARPPAGVWFTDNADGTATLSGTPTGATGKYKLTFTASNGVSSVTQNFTLTVRAQHGGGKNK